MDQQQPLVLNAGSKKQVESADQRERRLIERSRKDMRAVLATAEGRRVMWQLIGKCKVLSSIFETNSRIYYNAGQQDIGHYLLGEIVNADPDMWIKMQTENKEGV